MSRMFAFKKPGRSCSCLLALSAQRPPEAQFEEHPSLVAIEGQSPGDRASGYVLGGRSSDGVMGIPTFVLEEGVLLTWCRVVQNSGASESIHGRPSTCHVSASWFASLQLGREGHS